MKFKKINKLLAALVVSSLVSVVSVNAAPINGDIFFTNTSATANNGGPENATKLTNITAKTQQNLSNGAYLAIADGSDVTIADLDWSSLTGSGGVGALSVSPLWSVDGFTFILTSITSNSWDAGSSTRAIYGQGIANGPGYDPHVGTFQLSTSGTDVTIGFSSNTNVPDSGTTTALLGLSMLGLAGAARRLRK